MITPKLEELILSGNAQYKNYAGGWGAIYTIPCPVGKYMVITDITITDLRTSGDGGTGGGLALKITDGLVSNSFLFFSYVQDGGQQPIDRRGQNKQDTYILLKKDVRLRFARIPTAFAGIDFAICPEIANEPLAPLGYGSTNVLKALDFNGLGAGNYCPIGINNTFSTITLGMTNEPFPDITANSEIPQPISTNDNFVFNVGYVIVNIPSINN